MADDNEFNLFTLQSVLQSSAVDADGAANGQIALDMAMAALKCCPYKLILMDVNMPVMDGLKATRAIRKSFAEYMD